MKNGLLGLVGVGMLYVGMSGGCLGISFRPTVERSEYRDAEKESSQIDTWNNIYFSKSYDKANDLYLVKTCERVPSGKPFLSTEEIIIPGYRVEGEEPLQEGVRRCVLRVYKRVQ